MTNYEKKVIRPILSTIEKYQEYLTQPENLPQLAKLGFMFNTFWYAGRLSYGYHGEVKKGSTCENNPKYELGDTINYINEDIENLVYDAWGMHVSNDGNSVPFDQIKKMILEGKPLSEFEIKCRKPNKTFDEWVEVLTSKEYRYHSIYPNSDSVANQLLCVIGNGYGYNKETGFVYLESGGADQDQSGYGDWENSVFLPEILEVVKKVLDEPQVQLAVDAEVKFMDKINEEKRKEESEHLKGYLETVNRDRKEQGLEPLVNPTKYEIMDELHKVFAKHFGDKYGSKDKIEWYPISHNYSLITMLDEKTHPSYIKVSVHICEDIIANPPKIRKDFNEYQIKERNRMVEFAQTFLNKWKNI